jgi:hypothetical protein
VKELWQEAVQPYNLPLTLLLGLMVLFWLFTLFGGIGTDSLDGDLDADLDADIGAHFGLGSVMSTFLKSVNAGTIPLTIVLSILVLMVWMAAILLNYYLNPDHKTSSAVGFAFVALLLGIVATKLVTQPLVPFMRRLKAAEDAAPVVGEIGVVRSIQLDAEYGQVEVIRPDGAPAILNARLDDDCGPLARGERVVIFGIDEKTGVYLAYSLSTTLPDSSTHTLPS